MRDDLRLVKDLLDEGHDHTGLARLASREEIFRLRRGAYAIERATAVEERHRQLIHAAEAFLCAEAVISHQSAALLWGLPTWLGPADQVHVTRSRPASGRIGTRVHVHPAHLLETEMTVLDGHLLTSLARTAIDCARTSPYERSVAILDAALRQGCARIELGEVLEIHRRRHGAVRARRALLFADGRSESVGESYSRVVLARLGLPPSELQYEVVDPRTGEVVARADFGWEEHRTVGEFDGRVKYGRLLREGEAPGDVVFAEKQREDQVRDLGIQVVRWINADLRTPVLIRQRLERAFARNRG